jgi:hypothetical protein
VIHVIACALLTTIVYVAVAAGVTSIASRATTRRAAAGATMAVSAGDPTREAVGRRIDRSLTTGGGKRVAVAVCGIAGSQLAGA